MFARLVDLESPKRTLPFLVDLDCGNGNNLFMLWKREHYRYSRIVGFNYTGEPCGSSFDVFRGPVRFTQCLHIPWVVFSNISYERALDAVKRHGHPKSHVHFLTRRELVTSIPKMIYVTSSKKK